MRRLFTVIALVGLLLGSPVADAQAPQKKAARAATDPLDPQRRATAVARSVLAKKS